jgi:hypothetical protein
MIAEKNNPENLQGEYSQVNQNYRHFNNLRLTVFCFYFVIFLVAIVLTYSNFKVVWGRYGDQQSSAKLLWFLVTAVFLSIDIFCELNIRQLQRIAKQLEEVLGFRQFTQLATPMCQKR